MAERRTSEVVSGEISRVVGGRLSGWAADLDDPERTLSLDVLIDSGLVRKTLADRWSPAALQATGSGWHGFDVALPERFLDGSRRYLSVSVSGVRMMLPVARDWERTGTSQPDGTSFERMLWGSQAPELPGPRLLEGRDGWGFLCNDANGSLDQILQRLTFTRHDADAFAEILLRRHEECRRMGIPYLFALAPSKETIYTDKLPDTTPPLARPLLGEQIRLALGGAQSPVHIVDLHEPLRAARTAAPPEVYYRRDCHWNHEGGLVASRALVEAACADGVALSDVDVDRDSWFDTQLRGDLIGKPRVKLVHGRLVELPGGPEPDIPEPDRAPRLEAVGLRREQDVPEQLRVSPTRETRIYVNERRPQAPRAIVYRDSFGDVLEPFLSTAFSRSIWLWKPVFDFELIERERPDVLIQVVAERFLAQVPFGDTPPLWQAEPGPSVEAELESLRQDGERWEAERTTMRARVRMLERHNAALRSEREQVGGYLERVAQSRAWRLGHSTTLLARRLTGRRIYGASALDHARAKLAGQPPPPPNESSNGSRT
jgi:alginate O-acetyltransferase complex protein AlgJ